MKKNKFTYCLNLVLILLAVFLTMPANKLYSADDIGAGCIPDLRPINAVVYLGNFQPGTINTLPSSCLNCSNELEFVFTTFFKNTFDFYMDPQLSAENDLVKITEWTWEKADYNSNYVYGSLQTNSNNPYLNVKPIKGSGVTSACEAKGKFRITAKKLLIKPEYTGTSFQFTINVSVILYM